MWTCPLFYKEYHGDTSRMFFIGEISKEVQELLQNTEKAMWCGIEQVKPGHRINDIGDAIDSFFNTQKIWDCPGLYGSWNRSQFS